MNSTDLSKQLRQSHFLLSVAKPSQLPPDTGAEIAFVGASNVGKSSAINYLCDQQRLAFTSKTPGRTQLINFFVVNGEQRLVDLPGYGFAKVPPKVKQDWQQLVECYLQQRQSLRGLVVLIDCRHPLKPLDLQLLEWTDHLQLPVHLLLTKADKLSRGAAYNTLHQVQKSISSQVSLQLFSSLAKTGRTELVEQLQSWFCDNV